jgi:hypothetical protein
MEPAHWFEPGLAAVQDKVVIAAIDEVYSDLRLAERIASVKVAVRPEVMEPAHFQRQELPAEVMAEIETIMRRHGY